MSNNFKETYNMYIICLEIRTKFLKHVGRNGHLYNFVDITKRDDNNIEQQRRKLPMFALSVELSPQTNLPKTK